MLDLNESVLEDFVPERAVEPDLAQRYQGRVPGALLDIWQKLGYGSFMEGYLRVICPAEYEPCLAGALSLRPFETAVPIFASAFGDLFVWSQYRDPRYPPEDTLEVLQLSHRVNSYVADDLEWLLESMAQDEALRAGFCRMGLYEQARQALGPLAPGECYGFVPPLSEGGSDSVSGLQKVERLAYVNQLTEAMPGPAEYREYRRERLPAAQCPASQDYTLRPLDEETLTFEHLNFKLAVLQELMYNQGRMEPRFDVEDFARWYPGEPLDLDASQPLAAVLDYFRRLPIPKRLAPAVEHLYMDGGDDIYFQAYPNWDGEEDFFDVDELSAAELAQFPNLRDVVLMSTRSEEPLHQLAQAGIHAEQL